MSFSNSIGQLYKIIDHGIQKYNVGSQSALSGVLIIAGTYFCFKACQDIGSGNIKSGLMKGGIGTVALAGGVYHLITSWQKVVVDAHSIHCRKWSIGDFHYMYMQECTVFECTTLTPLKSEDYYRCYLVKQDPDSKGFSNVYDMKKADIYYELGFSPSLNK